MNEAISDRSKRVRGFLISWGIFSVVAALFVGIKGLFLVPVIPLVPAALLIKRGADFRVDNQISKYSAVIYSACTTSG
jgi:hypothetical protein